MRCTILAIILLITSSLAVSQTYLKPFIGVDFARVEDDNSGSYVYSVDNKGYSAISLNLGLAVNKKISKKTSLEFKIGYTKKEVDASSIQTLIPINSIQFNKYKGSLMIWYTPTEYSKLNAGIGPVIQYIPNFVIGHDFADYTTSTDKFNEKYQYGINFSLNYSMYGIGVEGYYTLGIHLKERKSLLKPMNAVGIRLYYRLNISN